MTATQFRTALTKLGLSQERAGLWLGYSIRAVHGWANGEPIPKTVAKLLRLVVRLDLKPDDVK